MAQELNGCFEDASSRAQRSEVGRRTDRAPESRHSAPNLERYLRLSLIDPQLTVATVRYHGNQTCSYWAFLNFPDIALMFFSRFNSVTTGRRRLLCRDSGGNLIDYAGFCFCFIALILAFTSFCTNAFGIALFAGKLIMAFVVA
jgi:hypothetical protein